MPRAQIRNNKLIIPNDIWRCFSDIKRCSSVLAKLWYTVFRLLSTLKKQVNSDCYMTQLDHFWGDLSKKWRHMQRKKIIFQQANALCHKSFATMAKLHKLYLEWLPHPPYSPERLSNPKNRSPKRNLTSLKKWSPTQTHILTPNINCSPRHVLKC